MKATLCLALLVCNAHASPPVQERITPETLAKLQQIDPMVQLEKPAEGTAKVTRPANQSIIQQSTLLHDGTHWTLVPIGAVIFLPAALKARVDGKPMGLLLPWVEFLTQNRGWITTHEVTLAQASGKVPLPADRAAWWAKQNQIVIAVHQNGPISVRVPEPTRTVNSP